MLDKILRSISFVAALAALAGCGANPTPAPTPIPPPLAKELTMYNWTDYMPQSVLDAFRAEYGVKVNLVTYDSQEEAVANIEAGKVAYDVAVIDNDLLPSLVADNLLAEINYRNVPNFKNIAADFRDLACDPGNRHSAPNGWGTTGLLVRSDLVQTPVTGWADLWDARYAGRIGMREEPTELISVALKSLGYPLNSEDPAQLEAASARLLELKKSIVFVESQETEAVKHLTSGDVVIMLGYSGDALVDREQNPAIQYVLPKEGTMLWGDSFVISAASPNQYTAELFLNFLLRPEISAQIVETYYYPTANEAARPFIDPDILNDPVVYPPVGYLTHNDFYVPLSPEGEKRYHQIWQRFQAAKQ